jgi:hypothetical protein
MWLLGVNAYFDTFCPWIRMPDTSFTKVWLQYDSSYIPANPVIPMAEKLKNIYQYPCSRDTPNIHSTLKMVLKTNNWCQWPQLLTAIHSIARYFLANKTICPVLSRSFPTWTAIMAIYAMLYAAGLTTNCRWRISLAVWKPSERHSAETSQRCAWQLLLWPADWEVWMETYGAIHQQSSLMCSWGRR